MGHITRGPAPAAGADWPSDSNVTDSAYVDGDDSCTAVGAQRNFIDGEEKAIGKNSMRNDSLSPSEPLAELLDFVQ